jgi:hypothetical protein
VSHQQEQGQYWTYKIPAAQQRDKTRASFLTKCRAARDSIRISYRSVHAVEFFQELSPWDPVSARVQYQRDHDKSVLDKYIFQQPPLHAVVEHSSVQRGEHKRSANRH